MAPLHKILCVPGLKRSQTRDREKKEVRLGTAEKRVSLPSSPSFFHLSDVSVSARYKQQQQYQVSNNYNLI